MVGYQNSQELKTCVLESKDHISELYFPWQGFTSGRGEPSQEDHLALEEDLETYSSAGIKLNLLLNGNCYGEQSQSRSFFQEVGDTVFHLYENWGVSVVTTSSPLIAKFLKINFPDIDIRASVNMEIGTPEGASYVAQWFDSFYLKREFNHHLDKIVTMRNWCDKNSKKLYLLANSGCLNDCSARTFHDNLVAHQNEIAKQDNAYAFKGVCHEYLQQDENQKSLLQISNFIRPEEISLYENFVDGIKLATRTTLNPMMIIQAYLSRKHLGNLLDLTEPSHAKNFYPSIIANDKIPADFGKRRWECNHRCQECNACQEVQQNATIKLND